MSITKLVRDKIPELMQREGRVGVVTHITGASLDLQLRQKLIEEAHEVVNASDREDLIEELADVMEVLDVLAKLHAIDPDSIEARRVQKKEKRGGFEKGILFTYSKTP